MRRKENEAKRSGKSEAKRNERRETRKLKEAKRNILRQNYEKTSSIYFCYEAKRKIRKRNKKYRSEMKQKENTEAKQSEKKILKRNETKRKICVAESENI